jgi:hypothetical protein
MSYFEESPATSDSDIVLGLWFLSTFDIDQSVSSKSLSSWSSSTAWSVDGPSDDEKGTFIQLFSHQDALLGTVQRAIQFPDQLYSDFYPQFAMSSYVPSQTNSREVQISDERHGIKGIPEENLEDRIGRVRTGGLRALAWIIRTQICA